MLPSVKPKLGGENVTETMTDDNIVVPMGTQDLKNIQATKIWVLEKSIKFLTAQHHEMLVSLQAEIENLKRRNMDLQRKLVLESGTLFPVDLSSNEFNVDVNSASIEELKKKIIQLQERLRIAQDANKLLKKDLDTRRRTSITSKHVAESHSPLIQKAEQVKTLQQNSTLLASHLNDDDDDDDVNLMHQFSFHNSFDGKRGEGANHSNRISPAFSQNQEFRPEEKCRPNRPLNLSDVLQNSAAPLPPINKIAPPPTDTVGCLPKFGCQTTPQPSLFRPALNVVVPTNTSTRLVPLKQPPPLPQIVDEIVELPAVPFTALPGLLKKTDPMRLKESVQFTGSFFRSNGVAYSCEAALNQHRPNRRNEIMLRSANGRIEMRKPSPPAGGVVSSEPPGPKGVPTVTLPALRQTIDVNQATRRRRTIEMQKKRLSHARNPYLS